MFTLSLPHFLLISIIILTRFARELDTDVIKHVCCNQMPYVKEYT